MRTVSGYDSVDELLGDRRGRFFGEGFKRVGQRLADAVAGPDPQGCPAVRATASLHYPGDWSMKSPDVSIRPHLSSIDIALFAIQLGELLLTHHHGLDRAQRGGMWLRRLTVRAGAEPVEDLSGFGVHARLGESRTGQSGRAVSRIGCTIGNAKVRCDIDHETRAEPASRGTRRYPAPAELLGADAARHFGDGFKERSHYVEDLACTVGEPSVAATARVLAGAVEERLTEGLGARYQPALSVLDSMIVFAQVNQALLYAQDGVDRQDTNTLWLRKLVLTAARPDQHFTDPLPVSGRAAASELVEFAGGRWRTFTMTGELPGFTGHSMLAHLLPGDPGTG